MVRVPDLQCSATFSSIPPPGICRDSQSSTSWESGRCAALAAYSARMHLRRWENCEYLQNQLLHADDLSEQSSEFFLFVVLLTLVLWLLHLSLLIFDLTSVILRV